MKLTLSLMLALTACAASETVLAREPPAGQMRSGQVLLVDDGRCPSGQISRVVGGSNRLGFTGSERLRTCIPSSLSDLTRSLDER